MIKWRKILLLLLFSLTIMSSSLLFVSPAEAKRSCNMHKLEDRYIGKTEGEAEQKCWYCKVVIIMTNAYLNAVSQAIPVCQELGHVILRVGFILWLAWYILQQVSAVNSASPGKMLQEILVMGFKVCLCNYAVNEGTALIGKFFIDPIIGTGVDYGYVFLTKIAGVSG